jgi:uncharacterized membrane protein
VAAKGGDRAAFEERDPTMWKPSGGRPAASVVHLAAMAFVGVWTAVVASRMQPPVPAPLVGWDAAAAVYLVWVWLSISRLDAEATRRLALREDPNRGLADALLLAASIASLLAVSIVLTTASASHGSVRDIRVAAGVASVILSWAVVHTVYTARYARLYYTEPLGGIYFHQDEPPRYSDFAYVSFTVGMTFQVSDTDLTCAELRSTVLRHSLLSYLFGAVIIAATVNLVASLAI